MPDTIGDRLRAARKRSGQTQRELARASGVSYSLIQQLEQGTRDDTRMETARKLASALRVPTTRLVSEQPEEGATAATVAQWAAVRRAACGVFDQEAPAEPPTVGGLKAALDATAPLYNAGRLQQLGLLLPTLIRDAETLAELDPAGRSLQVRTMHLTAWLLVQTRQFDVAHDVVERVISEAPDRLQAAAAVNTKGWLLLRQGHLADAGSLAEKWADELEPARMSRATMGELHAWGSMLLRVSAASVRNARDAKADDALRLAKSVSVAMGQEHAPREDLQRTFGPTTIAMKMAESAMVRDRPNEVLTLAQRVPDGGIEASIYNLNRHKLDVADAQTRLRQHHQAVETLLGIMRDQPEWLPNQRYARDIVGRIVDRRRTLTPKMRVLADQVGLPM
ncbi:helix-turn-helix domain-containing protein [Streptomyces profundus]|uniref:helix-turn-helix domain-containing protein n=1 Tax=Streptomyces profundus TaxID=2867410 RepID=UPI001D16EE43|nr:helix-turn-helix transcriptional regulator [Streptomyces sp. MA3_2.13]UED87428.1 helix-turn-helix domain-containing protein [Streptomyces sp. MA3_2.13]